jgi:L-amino acid N-acyltransferase YncA/protein-tyrosine-phosphatase
MRNDRSTTLLIRSAKSTDLEAIRRIHNEGIEDRATLDETPKNADDMAVWWEKHADRYAVLVAQGDTEGVLGWASLNPYSHRCAYRGVADLSIYVTRSARGTGVGSALLAALEKRAKEYGFHKIVLFTFAFNTSGQGLYRKFGYREVGIFKEQGRLDGAFVDVMAMEKILRPSILFVCRHNTGRSQMAEAYLREFLGNRVEVASAGTVAADVPDPGVVAIMAQDGIDIRAARPKLLDAKRAQRADLIITMGCDVEGVPRIDADWNLPDPKGQSPARLREIRDMVKEKARALAATLNT